MPTKDEIFTGLREHLVERGIEPDKIGLDADLTSEVGLDSLDVVELTVALEEKFGIEIPDEELEGVSTVREAVELVERKAAVTA